MQRNRRSAVYACRDSQWLDGSAAVVSLGTSKITTAVVTSAIYPESWSNPRRSSRARGLGTGTIRGGMAR